MAAEEETLEWRSLQVVGFPDYEIREDGIVRRTNPDPHNRFAGRVVKPFTTKQGYLRIRLCNPNGSRRRFFVHRLVLFAFMGPPPDPEAIGCHRDGRPLNNHHTNLRWDSQVGNMADKRLHGTMHQGDRHYHRVLSEADVRDIRAQLRIYTKGTGKRLAEQYGVARTTISAVRHRINWKHIAEE